MESSANHQNHGTRIWMSKHARKFIKNSRYPNQMRNLHLPNFHQFSHVKYHKTVTNIPRTHSNFFWNFVKRSRRTRGPNSKHRGAHNKKNSRNWKEAKSLRVKSPNPRIWWIRINLTLQERWIDPDPSGSWSNGPQ